MIKLASNTLWDEIESLSQPRQKKMAAVAYVTDDGAVQFGKGDLLVVDASDSAITSGQTSAALLKNALQNGVELYSSPHLHAKVMLFGSTAVVGSSNISKSSRRSLVEAGIITDQPSVVSKARQLIQQLKKQATPIDETFIKRIMELPVPPPRRGPAGGAGKKPVIDIGAHHTWLASIEEMNSERYVHETSEIEKGTKEAEERVSESSSEVDWIRFSRGVSHRFGRTAAPGDSVIQLWHRKGSKSPIVFPPFTILIRKEEPTALRFYVERFVNAKKRTLTWKQFERLTAQVGVPGKITPSSIRLIPESYAEALQPLWKGQDDSSE
jgi:hypothetical protein